MLNRRLLCLQIDLRFKLYSPITRPAPDSDPVLACPVFMHSTWLQSQLRCQYCDCPHPLSHSLLNSKQTIKTKAQQAKCPNLLSSCVSKSLTYLTSKLFFHPRYCVNLKFYCNEMKLTSSGTAVCLRSIDLWKTSKLN